MIVALVACIFLLSTVSTAQYPCNTKKMEDLLVDTKRQLDVMQKDIAELKNRQCNKGPDYETVGCFQDHGARAIGTLEGQDAILDGSYQARADAINKCYQAAIKRGFKVFAVQHGGWCAASATAEDTYDKYGPSSACNADGKGGPWANQVYVIAAQTITLCEGKQERISCKDGKTISVVYANYGRLNRETCKHTHMSNINCHAANSLTLVKNKCNKKNSCDLNSSNSVFGDPCGGTYKYLRVVYRCES